MLSENKPLIEAFKLLILQYQQELADTKNTSIKFKILSARKVLKILDSIDFKITNGNQLKEFKGIGQKTIDKINELLDTGKLNKLQNFKVANSISKELIFKES